MVFSSPYSGTFSYKGILPSAFANNVNTDIPKAIDKTNETQASGGGISGEIDVLSGGSIVFLSGSTLVLNSGFLINGNLTFISSLATPELTQASPGTDVAPGTLTIQAAAAHTGAVTNIQGGGLTLKTGAGYSAGPPGNLLLQVGSSNVLNATSTGTTLYGAGVSAIVINGSTIGVNQSPVFNSALSAPSITQTSVSSGNGQNMTIQAQSSTAVSSFGGYLKLAAGAGTTGDGTIQFLSGTTQTGSINEAAATLLPIASGTGQAFQVRAWNGSINTQNVDYEIRQCVAHTTAGGLNVSLTTITMPNSSVLTLEITWTRKATSGAFAGLGNKAIAIYQCDASGTVTGTALDALISASGAFDSSSVFSIVDSTPNTLVVNAIAQTAAMDWQVTITFSLN